MNVIHFWWKNARPTALPQSLLPSILAVCMASEMPDFSVYLGILALFGVVLAHLSANLFDDYFDYKVNGSAYRDSLARKGIRARIAKCNYLTSGVATLKQLLIACCIFGLIALVIGIFIFLQRGIPIVYLTLTAIILAISYSGAPLKLSYHGLGELVIFLMFGPLAMSGVFYAACGAFDGSLFFISIPVGLLVMNIVYVHSIMDYEPDKECGKMTFAVLLGSKKRMLITLFIILFVSYTLVIAGVIGGFLSAWYLLVLLTFPMAISLFYLMVEFVRHPRRVFQPYFWMGPMGNWERIKNIGIDWFMIRWLLARNLLSFFCLIIIVITLVF